MSKPSLFKLGGPQHVRMFTDDKVITQWRKSNSGVIARAKDEATITVYDVIGYDWWSGEGVTHKRIASALRAIGDQPVTVNINSPGGDVFEAIGILNELLQHPHKVTVNIVSMAASAATIVAMAGDEVLMSKGSRMMIHEAMSCACGTATEMREVADYIENISKGITDMYAERGTKTAAEFHELMSVGTMNLGTYMNADEAIECGLADGHYSGEVEDVEVDNEARAAEMSKRQVEQKLTGAGLTRSDARNFMNRFTATQDAGKPGMQDAAEPPWIDEVRKLTAAIRGET